MKRSIANNEAPESAPPSWAAVFNPLSWPLPATSTIWPTPLGLDDTWRWASFAAPIFTATHAPAELIQVLARQRCEQMIAFARKHSRFYARHLRHLPADARLEDLPRISRPELMANFDHWVTDPAITRDAVQAFLANPDHRGEPFLDRFAVWTSSGTTGVPGVYVSDPDALAVYEALLTMRASGAGGAQSLWSALLSGGRLAMIAALDGHFAGIVSWERMRRLHPWLLTRSRAFRVTSPTSELVAELNDWQPTLLSSYPSMLSVLGDELVAGRLRIRPRALWSGGEELAAVERERLAQRFSCPVFDEYGASECMSIAFSCRAGSLHLNADWVILEPIDERGRLLPPGVASAGTLLTNLANRVQPLIRYELGDSITLLPGRCGCGCSLPRLRVEGRHDDLLRLESRRGQTVTIVPLAIESIVEDQAGVHQFQLSQISHDTLRIRLAASNPSDRRQAWHRVRECLQSFLRNQGAGSTRIELDPLEPQANPVSGKLIRVRGLKDLPPSARRSRQPVSVSHAGPRVTARQRAHYH